MIFNLPSGHEVIVDEEDYEKIRNYKYYFHKKGYAYRFSTTPDGRRTGIYLHHDIVGNHKGKVVDHLNRNKLDNRKENLRIVENVVNLRNSGKPKGNHSSKYKGVSWNEVSKGWHSTIRVNGDTIKLGLFTTEEAAACAYNDYVKSNLDEFSHLNEVAYDPEWKSKIIKNRRNGVGKSKYVGVSWSKSSNKWQSHIMINYKSIYLGCYESEESASDAYKEAVRKYRVNKQL